MSYDPESLEGVPEHGRERLASRSAGPLHLRPVGQRVPARQGGGLRPARPRRRQLDLPHRLPAVVAGRTSQEMEVLSQAMYGARELAMTRMEEEADQLGADGIVGVRLDIGRYEWGANMAEFIAIGTAVKHRERRAAPRAERPAVHERPLGPGLLDAAARPATGRSGMVMGSCVYHVAHRRCARRCADGPERRAAELHAGALRRARAGDGAHAARGPGARGRGHRRRPARGALHGWGSHVIEFFAIGTAIVPLGAEPGLTSRR